MQIEPWSREMITVLESNRDQNDPLQGLKKRVSPRERLGDDWYSLAQYRHSQVLRTSLGNTTVTPPDVWRVAGEEARDVHGTTVVVVVLYSELDIYSIGPLVRKYAVRNLAYVEFWFF